MPHRCRPNRKRLRPKDASQTRTPDDNRRIKPLKRGEAGSFVHLASQYPDFAAAWSELKKRRSGRVPSSTELAAQEQDEEGTSPNTVVASSPSSSTSNAAGASYGGKVSFSTHVDDTFNLALTRSILHRDFSLVLPSMPPGRLCPPVPNRLNYVRWVRELVRQSSSARYFDPATVRHRGIDLGTGASCIYPLLLTTDEFSSGERWKFLGTEIDTVSAKAARENVEANGLGHRIHVELVEPSESQLRQMGRKGVAPSVDGCAIDGGGSGCGPVMRALEASDSVGIFRDYDDPVTSMGDGDGAIGPDDGASQHHSYFDFVMTNPPFYLPSSFDAMAPRAGDARARVAMTMSEGTYPNGEVGFVTDMIRDSFASGERVTWYTSMVGKKSTLTEIERILKGMVGLGNGSVRTTEFVQGKMRRWGIGWTYRRVAARSDATIVEGGLRVFEVFLNKHAVTDPVEEVATRICSYCQTVPGLKLKCTPNDTFEDGSRLSGKIVTVVEEDPGTSCKGEEQTVPTDAGMMSTRLAGFPVEGHFLIDVTVEKKPITDTKPKGGEGEGSHRDPAPCTVTVRLTCFSHSARGSDAINKVRSQMEGEVCRTNRRWRRILSRGQ